MHTVTVYTVYYIIQEGLYKDAHCHCLQGHPERMRKVNCLWKSQFSKKISFLNCFRSEISGKFMPYSIQVHQNHPKASLEAGASNVLLDCGWLVEANHWPETLSKDPNPVFYKFPRGKVTNINIFISIHTANFVLHKLKHQFWVFSQSLKVSGRPQTAYHSQKAHQRRQLLRMPRGDSGGLGCCRA